ncbi:hypothetical protein Leryth_025607 [Lithospermum erythrorhizon]|nr:hypothetical protein Leryth_025607 [Lithospermum erythrorhizon]
MYKQHVLFKKFQSLSCLYFKAFTFNRRSSITTISSLHRPKEKIPSRNIKKNKINKKNADPPKVVYMREIITKISNILRYSTWDDAQEQLWSLSINWDSYTVTQVLKTHPPMEKAWLFFNWARKLRGFKHDQFTYTTMLDIFGEARRISSMIFVFEEMKMKGIKIDAVTYTSLLHWLSNDGNVDGAAMLWNEMRDKGCSLTVVSYTAYMKILFDHDRVKEATDVYKEMVEGGLSPNCHTYTVLMEHLANSGKFREVMEIFVKMQDAGAKPDKAACNILMEKCCKAGKTSEMTKILLYMKENSLVLRYPVYMEALNVLENAGQSNILLRQVNRHFHSENSNECTKGLEQRALGANKLTSDGINILNLLEKKNLDAVDCLLSDSMHVSIQLDSRLISTIIEVNVASDRQSGALLAFDYSVKHGISINSSAYLALIGMFIRRNLSLKVVEIVEKMIQEGQSLGTQLSALLIHRLGCARESVAATSVFNMLPGEHKNTATYTALVGAFFASGNPDKALQTFETMKVQGIKVALGTYCILLSGLEKCGKVKMLESYRKEKKNLQAESVSQVTSEEERICNLLFAGNLVV